MSDRVSTARQDERRRIARELHDGAGQALTAARLQLIALRARTSVPRELVEQIILHVDGAMDEIRRSTTALAPPALLQGGLRDALVRHGDAFSAATGLQVRVDVAPSLPCLPPHVAMNVYRIVQEGLTNAARHARATRAWVTLVVGDGCLRLEVGDDGRGIQSTRGGFGLQSMRDRARLAGGTLELLRHPGPGGRVRATIPLVTVAA